MFDAINEFARASGRFDLTARGKVNTYGLFAEHFLNLLNEAGRSGIIVPTGIATDATTAPFFGHLVSSRKLARLFDFENSAPIFPGVHRSFKFCLLTLGSDVAEAEFSFFLTDTAQLEDARRRFTLSPDEIARINPNTKTAPVFRARADAELTAAIYNRVPVLIDEEAGGKPGEPGNPWGVEFRQGLFNMTSDSHLFRTADQLAAGGWERDGTDWVSPSPLQGRGGSGAAAEGEGAARLVAAPDDNPHPNHSPEGEGLSDAAHPGLSTGSGNPAGGGQSGPSFLEERYVPLYEAKMFNAFDHRFGDYSSRGDDRGYRVMPTTPLSDYQSPGFEPSPFYWTIEHELQLRISERNVRPWFLAFKDVTSATNERTAIFSAIPKVAVGHTAPVVFNEMSGQKNAALLANLNAVVLDFSARTKVAGLHLTYGYLKQLPILPPTAYSETDLAFIVPRVLELSYTSHSMAPFARDLGYDGEPFDWDEDRRADLRAELDAWYALAYGLTRENLRYILDPADVMGEDYPSETFRVLKKNEIKKHGEYRTQTQVLAAYDALVAGGMRPRTEGYR